MGSIGLNANVNMSWRGVGEPPPSCNAKPLFCVTGEGACPRPPAMQNHGLALQEGGRLAPLPATQNHGFASQEGGRIASSSCDAKRWSCVAEGGRGSPPLSSTQNLSFGFAGWDGLGSVLQCKTIVLCRSRGGACPSLTATNIHGFILLVTGQTADYLCYDLNQCLVLYFITLSSFVFL